MRPTLRFLEQELLERILAEARDLLATLGVEIHNPEALALLADHGAASTWQRQRALFPGADRPGPAPPPATFRLYDVLGQRDPRLRRRQGLLHARLGGDQHPRPRHRPIRQPDDRRLRPLRQAGQPAGAHRLAEHGLHPGRRAGADLRQLPAVPEPAYGEKPVVTGAFTIESFEMMKDLQLAVRGTTRRCAAKPLTVFSCCPTAPLKWSDVTSQNLVDCARRASRWSSSPCRSPASWRR